MINPDKLFGRLGNRMFQMTYIYSQMKEGKIPDIYMQDFSLFENHEEDIKKWYGNDIGFIPFVSIHIRRGDYVDNSFYTDLTKGYYYSRAIEMFPYKKFLVFSDDISFAKKYFTGDRFQFSEDNDEVTDLNLMASCTDHIIANSSFSWWAAYLGSNPGKTVISPREDEWYSDGVVRTKVPKKWNQISTK